MLRDHKNDNIQYHRRLLDCHKNNSTGNNSANIANEKAFVNRPKEKRLGNNIAVDSHNEKRR